MTTRRFLLTASVFLIALASAMASPSWTKIYSLKFSSDEEMNFTFMDNSFSVEIEGVSPDNVQLTVNSLPDNVSFVSSKKETVFIGSGAETATGTKVTIFLKFYKPGIYNITPLDLFMSENFYKIPFGTIEVFENPRFIRPVATVEFANPSFSADNNLSVKVSDHVFFTVNARFTSSVENIWWNIPENSLFNIVERTDPAELASEKSFSDETKKIAVFDWQPLKEGQCEFPEIFVAMKSYSGQMVEFKIPSFSVNVLPAEKTKAAEKTELPFAYAFADIPRNELNKPVELQSQDIALLFNFYRNEFNSLPFLTSAYKKRVEFQESLGLNAGKREANNAFRFLLLGLSAAFLVCGLIMKIAGKKRGPVLCLFFSVATLIFFIIYTCRFLKPYGIFHGQNLRAIPEKTIPSGAVIQRGNVVQILRSAGDWYFIRCNDTSGWTEKNNVLVIYE